MDVAFADESTSGVVRGATHLVSVHISLMRLRIWGFGGWTIVPSWQASTGCNFQPLDEPRLVEPPKLSQSRGLAKHFNRPHVA
jgi:hypothetical protein